MRYIAAVVLAITLSASAADVDPDAVIIELSISRGLPVSAAQAAWLIDRYFRRHMGVCGHPLSPEDRGETWSAVALVGYAATPDPNPIVVNKRTGAISWKGGPSYKSPVDLVAQ